MNKLAFLVLAVGMASCSGANRDSAHTDIVAPDSCPSISGQWNIENIVENDSCYIRPSELEQGLTAYIDFKDDNTFGVVTNCNHISGRFVQMNDSISLTDISATELACDNMEIEIMLTRLLPTVNSVDCINDSITRLNTSKGDSYIVLRKNARLLH